MKTKISFQEERREETVWITRYDFRDEETYESLMNVYVQDAWSRNGSCISRRDGDGLGRSIFVERNFGRISPTRFKVVAKKSKEWWSRSQAERERDGIT